jgi:hypothetical protein
VQSGSEAVHSEQSEQVFKSNCEVLDFNLVQEHEYLLVPNIYILNRMPTAMNPLI